MHLVEVHSGSNKVTVLLNNEFGGLFNPEAGLSLPTGQRPIAAVTGLFNSDPYRDIVVLTADSGDLSVFLGDGLGGFVEQFTVGPTGQLVRLSAGNLPSGLTAHDINGDGRLDLLIGNEYGDVLSLLGNGDGTFQPYQRAGGQITLAVADLNGDGHNDFVFANESFDRVSVQYSTPGDSFQQDRSQGLLAPGAISTRDLNGDGRLDLVLANSGGNSIRVYLGLGNGQFGPALDFFVGTNPASFSIDDLNGDGRLDLAVTNQGSNDVSILLGQGQGDQWTLTPGPRLKVGTGPVAITVADVNASGFLDLIVSNSQSRTITVLSGVGNGFFDDRNPHTLFLPTTPGQVHTGYFDGQPGLDLVVLTPGTGSLTFYSGFQNSSTIFSSGFNAVSALSRDFNNDGYADLLVGHQDNGMVSLMMGTNEGLRAFISQSHPQLAHLTDMALGNWGNGALEVFAVGEGGESVVRMEFFLDLSPILVGLNPSTEDGPSTAEVQFASLPDSGLGIVATLLIGVVPSDVEGSKLDALEDSEGQIIAVGYLEQKSTSGVGDEEEDEDEDAEDSDSEKTSLNNFIIGTPDPSLSPDRQQTNEAVDSGEDGLLTAWIRRAGEQAGDWLDWGWGSILKTVSWTLSLQPESTAGTVDEAGNPEEALSSSLADSANGTTAVVEPSQADQKSLVHSEDRKSLLGASLIAGLLLQGRRKKTREEDKRTSSLQVRPCKGDPETEGEKSSERKLRP
jgi:hypothetical protein